MEDATRDYYLLIFWASSGAIQVAVSLGRLKGLLLLRNFWASGIFGVVLIISAFTWYFATGPRNIGDTEGGLDANDQASIFAIGSLAGVIVTLIASSLVNLRMKGKPHGPDMGLEALKHTNYFTALVNSLRYWWKRYQEQTQKPSSG